MIKRINIGYILLAAVLFVIASAFMFSPAAVRAAETPNKPEATSIISAVRHGGKIELSYRKVAGVTGYQIRVAGNRKFNNAEKIKIKGAKNTSRTISVAEDKEVYISVRTYKKADGKVSYSKWCSPCRLIVWDKNAEFAKESEIHDSGVTLYYADKAVAKNYTVCINAGHGTKGGASKYTLSHPDGSAKVTGGTTAAGAVKSTAISVGTTFLNGTAESTVTLKLALKAKDELIKSGYNVLMIREEDDVQLDNVARTVLANSYADCHIALHYDSTTNDKGAFFISVPNVKSYRSMYPVSKHYEEHDKLGKALLEGFKKEGVKVWGSGEMAVDLTQTSYSLIPSVDLEVGDRGSDFSEKNLKLIAESIIVGLDFFLK